MDVKCGAGAPTRPGAATRGDDAGRWTRGLWTTLAVLLVLGAVGLDCRDEGARDLRPPDAGAARVAPWVGGMTGAVVLAEAKPGQQERVEAWRGEEGIRMAAELTGLPEGFFRWLEDKGVPVAEFVHFLVPFLEFIDMMESRNSTHAPPTQKRQAPTTI